jgi:hypothetical protein
LGRGKGGGRKGGEGEGGKGSREREREASTSRGEGRRERGTTRLPPSNQHVRLDLSPLPSSRRRPFRSWGNGGFKCCLAKCCLWRPRQRHRGCGVHVCVLIKGVGNVRGYWKGESGRRLRGKASETKWSGDRMHGTSARMTWQGICEGALTCQ